MAKKYGHEFFRDMESLNILAPTIKTLVTDHIPHIINFIQTIMDKGYAYRTPSGTLLLSVFLPILLPPATKLGQGNVFTSVCDSVHRRGACVVAGRGACVVAGGVCMVAGGHAWLRAECVVARGHAWLPGGHVWLPGGMHGCQGHAWLQGGMCGFWGGVCSCRGCAWLLGGMCGWQGACVVARGRE